MLIDVTGNDTLNAIQVSGYRTRKYGETVYWVSVTPVKVDGYCVSTYAFSGYKQTLFTAKRASKKAEAEAMAQAMDYVPRMIYKVCKDKDLTVTKDYDVAWLTFKAN